jgi:hypothetical protein
VTVFGLIRRDSQQRSAVVTMVLPGSALGCLVCLLGSVALGYRRFYGDAQCEYGHIRETHSSFQSVLTADPQASRRSLFF